MTPAKTMFLQIGRKRYQVGSFREASEMFCAARDASGFGASRIGSQLLVDERGQPIGYVAYNGRVFAGTPQAWNSSTPILFENRT